MQKHCLSCNTTKPLSEFNKHKSTSDGLQGYCRSCTRERAKAYHNKYSTPERNRRYNIRRYGITVEDFEDMLLKQLECCLICGDYLDTSNLRNVHIDHCHSSNRVRGILCQSCNHLLGNARDSIQILEAAIGYLKDVTLPQHP